MESAGEQANNSRASFKSRTRLGSPKISRGQLHQDPHVVLQKHAEVLKDLRKVDLATRKSYYLQLIEDLKTKNEQLDAEEQEQEYRQKLKQLPDEMTVQEELEKLNQQKRVTDMDIIDTENRIRHLLAEQEALEKDVVNFDFKTRKILEARKKKSEWEENTTIGLQQAEKDREDYLKMLLKRDQERAQTIAELRAEHDQLKSLKSSAIFGSDGQLLPSVGLKPDAEKKITGELFDLITAYETYVKQHKKLIAKNASIKDSTVFEKYHDKVSKLDALQENLQQKQQTILTSDSKLQQLKKLEEDLTQQKYVSLTRTEHYKNVYMDVVNSKVEQTKLVQLLETPKPLPHVTVSAKDSLHKILKNGPSLNEVAEPKPHVFTGPTKFVKANFGNYTQDRINKSKQFQHRDEIFNSLVNTSQTAPSDLHGRLGSKRAIEMKPNVSKSSIIVPNNKERFHSPKPRAVAKEFEPTMRFASPSGSKFVRKQEDTSYLQKNRLHRASSPSGVLPVTRTPIQAASRADIAKKPLRQGPLSRINEQNPSETTTVKGDVTSDGTKTASQYSPKHSANNGAAPQSRLRSPASRAIPGLPDRVMLKPSGSKQQVPKAIAGGRRKDDSKTDQSLSKLDVSQLRSAPEPLEPTLAESQVLAPSGTFKEKPTPKTHPHTLTSHGHTLSRETKPKRSGDGVPAGLSQERRAFHGSAEPRVRGVLGPSHRRPADR